MNSVLLLMHGFFSILLLALQDAMLLMSAYPLAFALVEYFQHFAQIKCIIMKIVVKLLNVWLDGFVFGEMIVIECDDIIVTGMIFMIVLGLFLS